jgi:hypothetical protein
VTYVDNDVMQKLYRDRHPFCVARTPDGVAEWFARLAADQVDRERIGAAGREWVVRHHSPEAAREQYVTAFREAVAELDRS